MLRKLFNLFKKKKLPPIKRYNIEAVYFDKPLIPVRRVTDSDVIAELQEQYPHLDKLRLSKDGYVFDSCDWHNVFNYINYDMLIKYRAFKVKRILVNTPKEML